MLEVSGGSGPPKARVLWGPIGTGGVNRRAVSLRSVFAHEPRVVFRDNKRATSSSAGTTTPRFRSFSVLGALSLFSSASRSFPSILVSSRLSSWLCSPLLASARFCSRLPVSRVSSSIFLRDALQSYLDDVEPLKHVTRSFIDFQRFEERALVETIRTFGYGI